MRSIQRVIVDGTDMPVFADASSAFFWGAHHLVFDKPGRWLIDGRWGSMGSAGGGVVGAAVTRGGAALAICGDGAMHMVDEINAAVAYGAQSIFVVLADEGLNIVRQGMRRHGRLVHDADYPATDFAAVAIAKGADGVRVTREEDLDAALRTALAANGPFVVQVDVDPDAQAPTETRFSR
jgi:acetolactate synthase-1/2/3 large subunit